MKSNKKQIISILAVLTMAILLSCAFVACDKVDTDKTGTDIVADYKVTIHPNNGQGDIVWDITKEIPTITKDGYHIAGYFLDAQLTISTTLESLKATGITKNIDVYVKWEEDVCEHVAVTDAAVEPTCTEKGLTEGKHCSKCGKILQAQNEIPALGHDLETHAGQPATCTEKGWEEYVTCKRDGCTYTTYQEIPALNHDIIYHEAKSPTCTEVGWGKYESCSRCDYTTYKEIAALDHDLVYHEAKSPTCAEVGWEGYESCSRCDYSTYKEIPARHNFDENGICVVCGYFETGLAFELNKDGESYSVVGIGTFDGTDLKIPNVNFDTKPVTEIKSNAFYECTKLTSVTIPDSVTSIGEHAFSDCTGLTSVTIGNSVTSIGDYAFDGCNGLKSITIPDSVTSTGNWAFYNTAWYNNQPNGLVYAGKVAYKYKGTMSSNTSIVLEEGTLGIGGGAFSDCTGLTSVTIPDSVTSIGGDAFYGCTGLTSVTIGGSVTSIGSSAFRNCTGLTRVTIPDSVTSIGWGAFVGCTGLTSIKFNGTIEQWNAISKGSYWKYSVPATQVGCTDGTISIE